MQAQVAILSIVILIVGALLFLSKLNIENTQPSLTYSNDLISIENVFVSNPYPIPGENITLSFYLKSNSPYELSPSVIFFDFQDLSLEKLSYSRKGKKYPCWIKNDKSYGACNFEISPFDIVLVNAMFRIPGVEKLPLVSEGKKDYRTIRFEVRYETRGEKEIFLPITPNINKAPSLQYSESKSSWGPLQLLISFPGRSEGVYGVSGMPLPISFSLSNLGTQGISLPISVKKLNISYPEALMEYSSCSIVPKKEGSSLIFANLKTGKQVNCIFYIKEINEEKLARILFEYEYTYSFFYQKNLQIQSI